MSRILNFLSKGSYLLVLLGIAALLQVSSAQNNTGAQEIDGL
jgi:hypothetical protein